MNNVNVIGRVATTWTIQELEGGKRVANARLAVKRGPGSDEADFISVRVWDSLVAVVEQYAPLGRELGITGRLQQDTFEVDGQRVERIVVVARGVDLLGPPPKQLRKSLEQEWDAADPELVDALPTGAVSD